MEDILPCGDDMFDEPVQRVKKHVERQAYDPKICMPQCFDGPRASSDKVDLEQLKFQVDFAYYKKDFAKALEISTSALDLKALQTDKQHRKDWLDSAARACFHLKNFTDALRYMTERVEIVKAFEADSHRFLAAVHVAEARFEDSITELQLCLNAQPHNAHDWQTLGHCYAQLTDASRKNKLLALISFLLAREWLRISTRQTRPVWTGSVTIASDRLQQPLENAAKDVGVTLNGNIEDLISARELLKSEFFNELSAFEVKHMLHTTAPSEASVEVEAPKM